MGVRTDASAVSEVHEMTMEGDVMKMRAIPSLDLPVGQTVELKPGGYHLMFMQLKAPLVAGSRDPLSPCNLKMPRAKPWSTRASARPSPGPKPPAATAHAHAQHGAPAQHKAGGMQHRHALSFHDCTHRRLP